jgi:hypothetical protein
MDNNNNNNNNYLEQLRNMIDNSIKKNDYKKAFLLFVICYFCRKTR